MQKNKKLYTKTDKFYLKGNSIGALLIHGFSGSPAEMKGLGDYLNQKGLTVLAVKLAGHGSDSKDMAATSLKDWMESAENGYKELSRDCKRVFIIGFSMGGLLAVELAKKVSSAGIVVMSPPMLNIQYLEYIIPILRYFKPWHVIGGGSDPSIFEPPYTSVAYPKVPVKCIADLLKLIRIARRGSNIETPILIMQGLLDKMIPQRSGQELLELVQSKDKELLYFEKSAHMLTLDQERDKVWRAVGEFTGYLPIKKNS